MNNENGTNSCLFSHMKEYVMEAKYIPTSMDALIRFLYSVLSLHCDSPRLLSHSFLSSTNRSLSGWVVLRQQCLHQLLFSFLSWLVFLQHLMKIKGCSAPQCILKGTPLKVQEMSSLLIYVFNEYKATVTVTDAGLCTVQPNRRVCLQHCWILCI